MKRLFFCFVLLSLFLLSFIHPGYAQVQSLPSETYIDGVSGKPQKYNLDCEIRSSVDWAAYFGVSLTEDDLLAHLPRSDNPEEGFVGDPDGGPWGSIPPKSYGVHAPPLAALLRMAGLPAVDRKYLTWEELQAEIAARRPVIVWVVGHVWNGSPIPYTTPNGVVVTVAAYEHTMIALGYNATSVYLMDAGNAAIQSYSISKFLASWKVLGNMAITYAAPTVPTAPFAPTITPLLSSPTAVDPWFPPLLTAQSPTSLTATEPSSAPQDYPYPTAIPQQETIAIYPTAIPMQELTAAFTLTESVTAIEPTTIPFPGETVSPENTLPIVLATPTITMDAPEAKDSSHSYTVRKGEYLMQIARRFHVSWQALAECNHLAYPYVVYPGQLLRIP